MKFTVHLFCHLPFHVPLYINPCLYVCSDALYLSIFCCLLCLTPHSVTFALSLSRTLSLSFYHNSKYPVGPGCRLLLVYLALGSIRLQAEASHSSQSHKMWLVLTTALRGDGLIGQIASDRLGTLQDDSSNSMLWIHPYRILILYLSLSLSLLPTLISVNLTPFVSITASVFMFMCHQAVCMPNAYISCLCLHHLKARHKLYSSSQTWMSIISRLASFSPWKLYLNGKHAPPPPPPTPKEEKKRKKKLTHCSHIQCISVACDCLSQPIRAQSLLMAEPRSSEAVTRSEVVVPNVPRYIGEIWGGIIHVSHLYVMPSLIHCNDKYNVSTKKRGKGNHATYSSFHITSTDCTLYMQKLC